jgi:hypothetical protein
MVKKLLNQKHFGMSMYGTGEELFKAKAKYWEDKFHELELMSPSERCRKFEIKGCQFCDSITCTDNESPLKQKVKELTIGTLR